jgi:polysaccharide pyruvyl transferase WcaK-like protein
MKKLLKKIYRSAKHKLALKLTIRNWKNAKAELETKLLKKPTLLGNHSSPKKVLIYSADIRTVIGSLGDQAMICATIDQLHKQHRSSEIYMLCKPESAGIVEEFGYKPVPFPDMELHEHPQFFKDLYERLGFDYFVVLGADIMDGYYSLNHPASALMASDLAVSAGIKSVILGFSFNKTPDKDLVDFYNRIDKRLILNVRESISLERVSNFATANFELVADAAFCLNPTPVPDEVVTWVKVQKKNGNQILGFNLHPMLLKDASDESIQNIIQSAVHSIKFLAKTTKVSFLLLPHDYRGKNGDAVCLEPIYELIKNDANVNAFFLEGVHRASALKGIAGLLDGVVTGRMHLAIASLGMDVPTMCITYQDKFEGLYRHFSLPSKLLLSPQTMMNKATFSKELSDFVTDLPTLKKLVSSKTPYVKALSEKNFVNL